MVNLAAWRRREIGRRLIEVAEQLPKRDVDLYDQDPLNLVCSAELIQLPSCWNVQASGAANIIGDARILHFTGRQKP